MHELCLLKDWIKLLEEMDQKYLDCFHNIITFEGQNIERIFFYDFV